MQRGIRKRKREHVQYTVERMGVKLGNISEEEEKNNRKRE